MERLQGFERAAKISIHAPLRERRQAERAAEHAARFQSTLPCGSDLGNKAIETRAFNFNPRSLAGATGRRRADPESAGISIHAPLRERLAVCGTKTVTLGDFNPRSLAGATNLRGVERTRSWISIHAPLRERLYYRLSSKTLRNFNPRSLAGATSHMS